MEVEYILFASFSSYMPQDRQQEPCIITLEEDATIASLIKRLDLPENKQKIIFLNGLRTNEDVPLNSGDRVGIFPLVAGG